MADVGHVTIAMYCFIAIFPYEWKCFCLLSANNRKTKPFQLCNIYIWC